MTDLLSLSVLAYSPLGTPQIYAQPVDQPIDDSVRGTQNNNSKHSIPSESKVANIVFLNYKLDTDSKGNYIFVGQVKNIGNNTATNVKIGIFAIS